MTSDLFSQPPLTIPFNRHKGNQAILEANRNHFGGQTKIVLELLMKGESVSSRDMFDRFNIVDCRARLFAIRKKGYLVTEERIVGGKGSKVWRMTKEQIEYNKTIK